MHHCLEITEIITQIFEECSEAPDFQGKSEPRLIPSYRLTLALVCKTFLEPALDVLWRTQGSLTPLLKCLPSDAWKVKWSASELEKTFVFERNLQREEWGRFNYYARRVRSLNLGSGNVENENWGRGSMFRFNLDGAFGASDRSLFVLSPHMFALLAAIPSLRKLRCVIETDEDLFHTLSLLPSHPFRALEEVNFLTRNIWSITGLLRALKTKTTALRKIFIEVHDQPTTSSLHWFFHAVVSLCVPANVTDIHIFGIEYDPPTEPPHHHLHARTIELLFALPNIKNLCMNPNLSTERITDSLVQRMVAAWPGIRKLDFRVIHHLISSVTLKGLAAFAKCRNLESLVITFKASPILGSWRNERLGEGFSCKTLKHLDVGRSEIEDPQFVAAVLSDIFPDLESLQWNRFMVQEQLEAWRDTYEAYKLHANIKQQERASALNNHGDNS